MFLKSKDYTCLRLNNELRRIFEVTEVGIEPWPSHMLVEGLSQ